MARPPAPVIPIVFARDEHERFVTASVGALCRCGACGARVVAVNADLAGGGHFAHVGPDCGAGAAAGLRGATRQALAGICELAVPRWLRASADYMDRRGVIHRFEQEEAAHVLSVHSVQVGPTPCRYKSDAIVHCAAWQAPLHLELQCHRGDNVDGTGLRAYFEDRCEALSIDVSGYAPRDAAGAVSLEHYVALQAPRDWLYHTAAEERYARTEGELLTRYEALMNSQSHSA